MNFNDLTDEQKAKAREAKSLEELLKLAEEEGIELSDEDLESVAGGGWGCSDYEPDTPWGLARFV